MERIASRNTSIAIEFIPFLIWIWPVIGTNGIRYYQIDIVNNINILEFTEIYRFLMQTNSLLERVIGEYRQTEDQIRVWWCICSEKYAKAAFCNLLSRYRAELNTTQSQKTFNCIKPCFGRFLKIQWAMGHGAWQIWILLKWPLWSHLGGPFAAKQHIFLNT